MSVDFFIPSIEQTEEVTIIDWLVADGATVNEGDEIIEIETDKAVVPVPANGSGVLHHGPYKAGDVVKTLAVIATIGNGKASTSSNEPTSPQIDAAPALAVESTAQVDTPGNSMTGPKTTPVAQKMAADLGIDLNNIIGSGEQGKITKADIQQVAPPQPVAPVQPVVPVVDPPAPAKYTPATKPVTKVVPEADDDVLERIPFKGIRGVIARRMAESVHTTARVTLGTEADATELVALREQLKAKFTAEWGFAPGYNDLLAMIVANGLRQFPYMNARFSAEGDAIEYLQPIHMGMAVDTDQGLLVPVIKNIDQLGLQELGTTFRELVSRARAGKNTPNDLSGSTFTITSLGINRVDVFTPVINMPNAAILGIGRIHAKPVVKDDEIVARKMMSLSLVFDHRLTDGAPAARFLDYICELIEEPYLLFLTKR